LAVCICHWVERTLAPQSGLFNGPDSGIDALACQGIRRVSPGLKRTRGLFMDAPAACERLRQAATAGVLHEGSQGGSMNEKSPASPWPAGDRTNAIARQTGRAVGSG